MTRIVRRSHQARQAPTPAESESALRWASQLRFWSGIHPDDATLDPSAHARRRIRAAAARATGMVVSHQSAAVLWGAPMYQVDLAAVHFTRPGPPGGYWRSDRIVHSADLADPDTTEHAGVQLTSPVRTLFDLARTLDPDTAVVAGDWFVGQGLVSNPTLAELLERNVSTPGRSRALRVLRAIDGRSTGPGQTLTRLAVIAGGLPPPELQIEVRDAAGTFLGRADFGYPELGVVGEFDGLVQDRAGHPSDGRPEKVVIAEKRREDAFREAGATVVRLTWAELERPEQVIQRISTARRRAERAMAAGSVTGRFAAPPAQRLVVPAATGHRGELKSEGEQGADG